MKDVEEVVSIELTEEEALRQLGATQLITTASRFGNAEVQEVVYPTHQYREDTRNNIKGLQDD